MAADDEPEARPRGRGRPRRTDDGRQEKESKFRLGALVPLMRQRAAWETRRFGRNVSLNQLTRQALELYFRSHPPAGDPPEVIGESVPLEPAATAAP